MPVKFVNRKKLLLDFKNDLHLLPSFMERVREEIPKVINSVNEAIKNEDVNTLKVVSHNLKGSIQQLNIQNFDLNFEGLKVLREARQFEPWRRAFIKLIPFLTELELELEEEIKFFEKEVKKLLVEDNWAPMEHPFKDILIVEHDKHLANLIAELLDHHSKEKLNFTFAYEGKKALEITSQNDFDLILLDWHIPQIQGGDLIRVLFGAEKVGSICPVVFITSSPEKAENDCGHIDGVYYIGKPLSMEDLKKTLIAAHDFIEKMA